MSGDHKTAIVATRTVDGRCDSTYVTSLFESARALAGDNVAVFPVLFDAVDSAGMFVNAAITAAWREGADSLVLAGPDVSWPPELMRRLVLSESDAIAAPVATDRGFEVGVGDLSRVRRDPDTGDIRVMSASIDLIRLSRRAVSALCESNPSVSFMGGDVRHIVHGGDMSSAYRTEGEVLSSKLFEVGIELVMCTAATAVRRSVLRPFVEFSSVLEEALGCGSLDS